MTATLPSIDKMYQALLDKDARYDEVFIAGVKTTGIFCRPTCTSRKPQKKNVTFFCNIKQALDNGYRACKICKPIEVGGQPTWINALLKEVARDQSRKWKGYELEQLGYDPSKIRRYFKKHYGMTFQAYLRMNRINNTLPKTNGDNTVTDTVKTSTVVPSSRDNRNVIMNRIPTPLGPVMVGVTNEGLCLLEFTDRKMLEKQLEILKKRMKVEMVTGKHPMIDLTAGQLEDYFKGSRKSFDIPLVWPGTDFQHKVWNTLIQIPYGVTRSYKQQANAIGDVKAVRAVARANGENRISIIVPCHRIIGSDGSIVGYGGGIHRKQWLLKHEFQHQ